MVDPMSDPIVAEGAAAEAAASTTDPIVEGERRRRGGGHRGCGCSAAAKQRRVWALLGAVAVGAIGARLLLR